MCLDQPVAVLSLALLVSRDVLLGKAGVLEMADLSLDEPDLEAMLFLDDGNGGEENETIRV